MRFTPILIVYLVLLFMMSMMMRELNKCTENLRKVIHETQNAQGSTNSND
jgi:CHASE3 domain sensor protein